MKTIVLSAFSCAPNFGSEERVGWQAVSALRGHYVVHVFIDGTSPGKIGDNLVRQLREEQVYIHFYNLGEMISGFSRKSKILRNLYYNVWQMRLSNHICKTIDATKIDLVHHVSWARYSTPTSLGKLGKPLVIGPIGGGDTVPKPLLKALGKKDRAMAGVRRFLIYCIGHVGILKRCYKQASVVIACTEATKRQILRLSSSADVKLMPLLTIEPFNHEKITKEPFTVVSTGRLLGWKGFSIVIKAFFQAGPKVKELIIIGDGPERSRLEGLVSELNCIAVPKSVRFMGSIENSEVMKELEASSVFCFGSMHDSGGYSLLEAMSVGLPVVCFDLAGPGVIIDETCGVKIQVDEISLVVKNFAGALDNLQQNRELCTKLSPGAQSRLKKFSLDQYRSQIQNYYECLLRSE